MNRQRIRDIPFRATCKVCGFSEVGRQLGRNKFWENNLVTLSEVCPRLRSDPHGSCPDFPNRAEIIPL
jgi:hypothetical protein